MAKKMPLKQKKQIQKVIFIIVTVLISVGLVGSSIAWVLGGFDLGSEETQQDNQNFEEDVKANIEDLEAKVKADPNDKTAFIDLAVAYSNIQDWEKSAAAYEKALELDPKNNAAHLSVGIIYYYLNKYDEAEEHLKTAVVDDPSFAEAYYWYGHVLALGKNDYKGGIEQLEKFVEIAEEGPDTLKAKETIEEWKGELVKQKKQ